MIESICCGNSTVEEDNHGNIIWSAKTWVIYVKENLIFVRYQYT